MVKCSKCSTTVELPVTFPNGNQHPVVQIEPLFFVSPNNDAENQSNVFVGAIIEPITNVKIEELEFFDLELNPESVLAGLVSNNPYQTCEWLHVSFGNYGPW